MKKISRVSRLRDYGIFRDFRWSSDLSEFMRYNLIYGWNGTGKTTLSRLFRDLELKQAPETGKVQFCINGKDVPGESFPRSQLPIRVFNRDFIEENVWPAKNRDMPPIFVIGAESIENQKKVEDLKLSRSTVIAELQSVESAIETADKKFDDFCIGRAKTIKEKLRTSGGSRYNNYTKTDFKNDATQIDRDSTAHLLSEGEREKLLARHRGTSKPRIDELTYSLPKFNEITKRVSDLLTQTVFSSTVIDTLTNDLALSNWISQGLHLHEHRSTRQCLFCEQPFPQQRLDALRAHFNDEYEQLIRCIDQEIQRIKTVSEKSEKVRGPSKNQVYPHLVQDLLSSNLNLGEALISTREFLSSIIQALEKKKERPFEEVQMEFPLPVGANALENLNELIREHNKECDAFKTKAEEARGQLARHMISEELQEYVRLHKAVNREKDNRQEKEQELRRLNGDIGRLERELVNHRQPAEDLNEDLKKYLGYDDLYLEIKETGYAIFRYGIEVDALSEGETTAIALLYFLRSLQDSQFRQADGVVVLDDPVSSLDSNALFLAFGLIRERTKDVGQLFILTHNFSFFRQVRNWFGHERDSKFLMLESVNNNITRNSTIRNLDPLLAKYDSEYHYLFARIYESATDYGATNLEENYVLPNMARRMLEVFLSFRYPQVVRNLRKVINKIPFDETKKLRILRFLHTHSHGTSMGEPEHDLSALSEGPSVLQDLLDMIKSEDNGHFSAMKELVDSSINSDRGK